MDPHGLLLTALRALGVYLLMLVVIRALGKRTVGNFSAFDLLVALMTLPSARCSSTSSCSG